MLLTTAPTFTMLWSARTILSAGVAILLLTISFHAQGKALITLEFLPSRSTFTQHQTVDFHLKAFDRRVITSDSSDRGYSLSSTSPYSWMGTATIKWDFGDGTPTVSTGERLSVMHRYEQPGTYTLSVTASDGQGQYAIGSKQVIVKNQAPNLTVAASTTPGVEQSFDFHAANIVVRQTPGESFHYDWDFGDGNKQGGQELSRVSHRYSDPGTYTVLVTATDEHGDTGRYRKKVRIRSADQSAKPISLEGETIPETVQTGFKGSLKGTFPATLDAEVDVLPPGGLYYLVRKKRGVCELKFSFADEASGVAGYVSLVMQGLSSRGARYTIRNANVMMAFNGPSMILRAYDATVELIVVPDLFVTGKIKGRVRHYKRTGKGLEPQADFLDLDGDFGIDLLAHQQSEIMLDPTPSSNKAVQEKRQEGIDAAQRSLFDLVSCGNEFTLDGQWPADGTQHLPQARPAIRVKFSDEIDPASVTNETFQVGYPDTTGRFVQAPGKLLVDSKAASFVPDRALRSGVYYSAQVKTGERGITSAAGKPIESSNDDNWHRWKFSTALDFAGTADQENGLFCHVYQTSRDVPLIAYKPAMIRVFAQWSGHKDVLAKAQIDRFNGEISIGDYRDPIGSTQRRFFRPDVYKEFDIDKSRAQHTAQVPFTPVIKVTSKGPVKMLPKQVVSMKVGESEYFSACSLRQVEEQPKPLTVDVYRMVSSDKQMSVDAALAKQLVKDAQVYAWQSLPLKDIVINGPFPVDAPSCLPMGKPVNPDPFINGFQVKSEENVLVTRITWVDYKFPGYLKLLLGEVQAAEKNQGIIEGGCKDKKQHAVRTSNADIVVVIGPLGLFGGKARTERNLVESKQGFIASFLDGEPENYQRHVYSIVHEIGHVLLGSYNHAPDVGDSPTARKIIDDQKVEPYKFWFKGIEGYRMNPDGKSGFNMSSVEGNPLSNSLTPLMFVLTMDTDQAFIANHRYRKIQDFITKNRSQKVQ